MTETATPDLQSLRDLLADVDSPPLELVEELSRRRQEFAGDPALLLDLDRLELRFLEKQVVRRGVSQDFRAAVSRARREALERTFLRVQRTPTDDVATLFDLAELRAAFLFEQMTDEADSTGEVISERVQEVALDERLEAEARERFAVISTDEEDLPTAHKIHLLREYSAVMGKLHWRSGKKVFRSLERRLLRVVGDRGLAQRMEAMLTRRGLVWLETTSLSLLVVVFVLILIEATVVLGEATLTAIHWTDAIICSLFILEFFFKLALAPSRTSWFLRNVLTDLLPALPAAMFLLVPTIPGPGQGLATVRAARFFRLVWFARYVQALRPLLGLFRLLLFLIRGLDSLVQRFSSLINRNFVFFEAGTLRSEEFDHLDPRSIIFQAIRREHVLLEDLPLDTAGVALTRRADALTERLHSREIATFSFKAPTVQVRDVPVEDAIERLYTLRPDELSLTMSRPDLMALDRVTRVINVPVIRSLPFIRWFSSEQLPDSPEARVVSLCRRIADLLERWRGRILFFADLHGIVTGPQVLDRFASWMVRVSQRPAVRLVMFGGLFWLVRMFVEEGSALSLFLARFVAAPLVVLGGVCFVFLLLGRWLKSLAGEASESLKRTSEAHFINLLELVKARTRDADLIFLAKRVFRFEMDAWEAALALGQQVQEATSIKVELEDPEWSGVPPDAIREDLSRVAYLYMHFLDGAILHESDIKTTEQLLANLSLENIRKHHLRFSRRDRKRVRKLSLAHGSILSGPYLWFRFITESISLETAKRITEYNRHCLSLEQRSVSTEAEVAAMANWLAKRRQEVEGRILEKIDPPYAGTVYRTTEFNSLDFLALNPQRDRQIERVFGSEVLEILRMDRRSMIREIFGTRPLHKLPRSKRSVNFYMFFINRLSRGRVLLAPLLFLGAIWFMIKGVCGKTMSIVREILRPEAAGANRESGHAPFRVALRKIHRMKAPGLLEAMQMRACFDPAYCGAPPTWSFGMSMEEVPEIELDMDFLQLRERERESMRHIAAMNRRRVETLHRSVGQMSAFDTDGDEMARKFGERAVTIAYITNRDGMRSLMEAERWLERELPALEDRQTQIRGSTFRSLAAACRRAFRPHPVRRLVEQKLGGRNVSRRGRRNLKRRYLRNVDDTRLIVNAWVSLPEGVQPSERAAELAHRFFRAHGEVSRELAALRAVQSLSVLDVRNYRDLVFKLGGYAEEGEDPAVAEALP